MKRRFLRLPSVERLNELLVYCPATGVLRWRTRRGGLARAGTVAGRLHRKGHREISVDGVRFKAHRIAFKMVTGVDPDAQIDHIDRNPGNNRISNLRLATNAQNRLNSVARGASGLKGAYKSGKKFVSSITINGVVRYLGTFDTATEANERWWRETLRLRGEYARRE
jgi:hypothetical protein